MWEDIIRQPTVEPKSLFDENNSFSSVFNQRVKEYISQVVKQQADEYFSDTFIASQSINSFEELKTWLTSQSKTARDSDLVVVSSGSYAGVYRVIGDSVQTEDDIISISSYNNGSNEDNSITIIIGDEQITLKSGQTVDLTDKITNLIETEVSTRLDTLEQKTQAMDASEIT